MKKGTKEERVEWRNNGICDEWKKEKRKKKR